jgi:hypothetical protein
MKTFPSFVTKIPNWMRTACSRDPKWTYKQEMTFAVDYIFARRFNSLPDEEQHRGRLDLIKALEDRLAGDSDD